MAGGALSDIRGLLETVRSHQPSAMKDVMPALREHFGAEHALAVEFDLTGAVPRLGVVHGDRINAEGFRRRFDSLLSKTPIDWAAYNPARPEPRQRNRTVSVVRMLGWQGLRELPAYRDVIAPAGMANQDQLRVLVCEGASLLAWVGVLRSEPFSPAEVRALQSVTPALARRLTLERRLAQERVSTLALGAALEQLGAAAWVIAPNGAVLHANAAGKQRYDADRRALSTSFEAIGRRVPVVGFDVTAVTGTGERPHLLVIARGVTAPLDETVDAAARRWELTERQREVLWHLAQGRTNKRIAADLGRSEKVIEFHVTAILAKANVDGRSELIATLWRTGRDETRRS